MIEAILIILTASLIYYVATKLAPKGLLFKLKKEEERSSGKINKKPISKTKDREEGLLEKAQDRFNSGNLELAEKILIDLIQTNPKESRAYYFLGMIYLRQKEYKGAAEVLKKATELDQLNDIAFNNLGLAYHNIRKYQEAIDAFQKSIQLNDKIAHRYVNLGLSQQCVGDFEKAALSFENANQIHENVESLTIMAKNYIKIKDKKLAKYSLERLLKVDPTNSWAKRILASYR